MNIFRDENTLLESPNIKKDDENIIHSLSEDSDNYNKIYMMYNDGNIIKSKNKLNTNIYRPPYDEDLDSPRIINIIEDLTLNLKKNDRTDIVKSNYYIDSSEEEINNWDLLRKLNSNKIFTINGGYIEVYNKYKNKLKSMKRKLEKLKEEYPEYYYLNGGLKLDDKINKELSNENIKFTNVKKIIFLFNKII